MPSIGIWHINQGAPVRGQRSSINLEKELEDWIERDPSLIHFNLAIVGRQMHVEAGILDLLGIDALGNWVIIEIKRGNVRRETVMQALDYAACIAEMAENVLKNKVEQYLSSKKTTLKDVLGNLGLDSDIFTNRTIDVYVVGTGRDEGYERLARFIKNPINIVTFDVFVDVDGKITIIRELEEIDSQSTPKSQQKNVESGMTLDGFMTLATQNGVGEQFQLLYDAATKYGLYPRLYKSSIMYTPPQHKNRCCIVASVKPVRKLLNAYAYPETFAEFFNISEQEASDILGFRKGAKLSVDDTKRFTDNLGRLFQRIAANSE